MLNDFGFRGVSSVESAFRRGRVEREGWRVRKDGSKFWAHVILTALHDERARLRGFSQLTRDITERKRVEMALAERAEELLRSEDALQKHTRILRSVLDSMGEGVVVCDEDVVPAGGVGAARPPRASG